MPDAIANLATSPQFVLAALLYAALGLYASALIITLIRPHAGAWVLRTGIAVHVVALIGRGWAIAFFPLTNNLESFSAAALAIAVVTSLTWRAVRLYTVPLLLLVCATSLTALSFPLDPSYPPPLMRTLWYPLHVPFAFLSYAVWAAAAAGGLVWLREPDAAWLARIDRLALQGFALWSFSMICGGVWGVLAWGAYFLWDVKVIWSVILWFHYASFIQTKPSRASAGRTQG